MKILITILSLCFVLISLTIVYLVRSGVSIRTAPIIKPSIISQDFSNVSEGVFLRLFPDFQTSDFIIWGGDLNSREFQHFLDDAQKRYEHQFKQSIHRLSSTLNECPKPCWIVLGAHEAHQLERNLWIEKNANLLGNNYVTLTWVPFQRNTPVTEECLAEKSLDFSCLKSLSIQETLRKMKDLTQRYFFMRKYKDRDYFLFIESK